MLTLGHQLGLLRRTGLASWARVLSLASSAPPQCPPKTSQCHVRASALSFFTHNSHLGSTPTDNSSPVLLRTSTGPVWKGPISLNSHSSPLRKTPILQTRKPRARGAKNSAARNYPANVLQVHPLSSQMHASCPLSVL